MKATTTRTLIFVSLLAQLGLAISPFVPWVHDNVWSNETSVNAFASTLASYVGVEFVCLSVMVGLVLVDVRQQSAEASREFRDLLRQYTPLQVRNLREDEFYKEFLGHCFKAKHYVKICYFAPRPPHHGAPQAREVYYRQMIEVMRDNPETTFRRIVRDTHANREWANELVSRLLGTTNCSVALLKDLDASVEMPLALSVQVIDEREAWLVAVSEHTGSPMYRDVAIENELLAAFFSKYFDRLWGLSRVVFVPGDTAVKARKAIFEE